jgi:phenylacetate-CoA ligase
MLPLYHARMTSAVENRRQMESLDRAALERHQVSRLNALLDQILPQNRFYAEKLAGIRRPIRSLGEMREWNFTFKQGLISRHEGPDRAANLTWPVDRYSRFHQTSGTRGRPMVVLDLASDWPWWLDCWQYVLDAAEIVPGDRVMFAFSFGPFVGFWSAFDAVIARGCLTIPSGGMSTRSRLDLLCRSEATVLFCTPSYALHLAEVAEVQQLDVGKLGVRVLVLAGESGGSIPAIRTRLETTWQAVVIDHAGASEVGPWGYGYARGGGMYINEAEFIAEFLSIETGEAAKAGELSELVLTTLGRAGAPVIRYRTGDLVRPNWSHSGSNRFVFLDGGVVGRADDMLIIRGVNIFPSAIDQILRSFPEVVEYRATARTLSAMDFLVVEVEDRLEQPQRIADELQLRLGLRVEVQCVPLGSLPRFEGKGRRLVDERVRRA